MAPTHGTRGFRCGLHGGRLGAPGGGRVSSSTGPRPGPCRVRLFGAFAGLGGTASLIPAAIPLSAQAAGEEVTAFLGAVPALFFGLAAGVLLSAALLRRAASGILLGVGSLLQGVALLVAVMVPSGTIFTIAAAVAGIGFGLCEACGSVAARAAAGAGTPGLLSALTGIMAVVAAATPLLVAAGAGYLPVVPVAFAVALLHLLTASAFLLHPRSAGAPAPVGGGQHHRGAAPHQGAAAPGTRLVLLTIAAALFLYVGAETVFAGWSAVIAAEALALSASTAALGTSVFWTLMAVGRFTAWLILKVTSRTTALLAAACVLAAASLTAASTLRASDPGLALAMTGLAVTCLGPMYSLVLGSGMARLELRDAGRLVSLLVAAGAAGGAVVPAVLASFTNGPSSPAVFLTAAALLACVALLAGMPGRVHTAQTALDTA